MSKDKRRILLKIGLAILSFFWGNNFMSPYVNKSFSSPGFVVSLLFFFTFSYFWDRQLNNKDKKWLKEIL